MLFCGVGLAIVATRAGWLPTPRSRTFRLPGAAASWAIAGVGAVALSLVAPHGAVETLVLDRRRRGAVDRVGAAEAARGLGGVSNDLLQFPDSPGEVAAGASRTPRRIRAAAGPAALVAGRDRSSGG